MFDDLDDDQLAELARLKSGLPPPNVELANELAQKAIAHSMADHKDVSECPTCPTCKRFVKESLEALGLSVDLLKFIISTGETPPAMIKPLIDAALMSESTGESTSKWSNDDE